MPRTSNLGKSYHDDVEKLKAGGMKQADAIREVAKQYGKNEGAIRGGIYAYKKSQGSTGSTGSGKTSKPTTVDEFLGDARKALESAIKLVKQEAEDAKAALDAAQARYESASAAVKPKVAELEAKLKALIGS